jgi:hypothetical protein
MSLRDNAGGSAWRRAYPKVFDDKIDNFSDVSSSLRGGKGRDRCRYSGKGIKRTSAKPVKLLQWRR